MTYKIEWLATLSILLSSTKKHVSAFEYIKAAFIQVNPKETAYYLHTKQNYYRGVFSTHNAAINWIKS
jgi:hypothetical protein